MLLAGKTHIVVAEALAIGRHTVSRHVRNGHVAQPEGGAVAVAASGGDLDRLIKHLEGQLKKTPGRTEISRELRIAYAERKRHRDATLPSEVVMDLERDVPRGVQPFFGILFEELERIACEKCGHHNGLAVRLRIKAKMDAQGIDL